MSGSAFKVNFLNFFNFLLFDWFDLLSKYPVLYSIRLVSSNSTYPSEGRVEINYVGQWGTVCGNSWDSVDAGVVCNQLGFSGQSQATRGLHGQGSGIVWLDNVGCTDGDEYLATCYHSNWVDNTCDHSNDAGVICSTSNNVGKCLVAYNPNN